MTDTNINASADKAFCEAVLKRHNFHRANHKTPPLKLNPELSNKAQAWADKCGNSDTFAHSSDKYKAKPLGENIAMSGGSGGRPAEASVDQWYDEISSFAFGCKQAGPNTGHFTQVVWKGSHDLGVGRFNNGSKEIVVCNYFPAGNMMNAYDINVLKKK